MDNALQDQSVLVLGCGLSGLAMARWCARLGARVTVADTREAPPNMQALRESLPGATLVAAPLEPALLDGNAFSLVLRSPGLPPAQIARLLQAAAQAGARCMGELDLFSQALQALRQSQDYAPQLLAVTGTNGKTTVTALTGLLVARAGRSVAVAGNIGPTLLDTLAQRLDAGTLPQVWVIELSSFQLDGAQGWEPTAATVLNLSQDHLDWHGDMRAYAAAKARVFGDQGLMVLNRDDPLVMAMLPPQAKGRNGRLLARREYLGFGDGPPQRPGDFGIATANGMAWLVRAMEADETQSRRRRRGAVADEAAGEAEAEAEIHLQRLMPVDALRIRGRHNALNALAALALATASGCQLAPMLYGLREYRGEPHRVEPVATVHEVEYFDDSKGTNVGATVAALTGLGEDGRRLVVILGGDGKGQDFGPLAAPVTRHARAVVLIGRDAPRLREALAGTGVPLHNAASMDRAVDVCAQHARPGDAVLMSPACASLDMFRNYGHRAAVFRAAVERLAGQAGCVLEAAA